MTGQGRCSCKQEFSGCYTQGMLLCCIITIASSVYALYIGIVYRYSIIILMCTLVYTLKY